MYTCFIKNMLKHSNIINIIAHAISNLSPLYSTRSIAVIQLYLNIRHRARCYRQIRIVQ